jgi:hypothetical protein
MLTSKSEFEIFGELKRAVDCTMTLFSYMPPKKEGSFTGKRFYDSIPSDPDHPNHAIEAIIDSTEFLLAPPIGGAFAGPIMDRFNISKIGLKKDEPREYDF